MQKLSELETRPFPLPSAMVELYEAKRNVTVGITVPASIARRIEAASKADCRTRSEWCARIISAALDAGLG